MGRQADFHGGTRESFITRLQKSDAPGYAKPRRARLTDDRLLDDAYTNAGQIGTDRAVLPEVPPAAPEPPDREHGSAAS